MSDQAILAAIGSCLAAGVRQVRVNGAQFIFDVIQKGRARMQRLPTIALALVAINASVFAPLLAKPAKVVQPTITTRAVGTITVNGLHFRDLDRDGKLTPFEDWRLPPDVRATDLLSRMTLEEKAGAMMHPVLSNKNPEPQIQDRHVTSFLLRASGAPAALAEQTNRVQELAEKERLAIPVLISTDPRNGVVGGSFGTSVSGGAFSRWPDATGFGAIGDPAVVRNFGRIAAQEYRAVGITMALSPQADLATEPRWGRIEGTFGEDPVRVGALAAAYVEGFQGGTNGATPGGVATVVKHFAGYGAAKDGFDSHNYYGRYATLSKKAFDRHVSAFQRSFKVKVEGVMPTYSILQMPGHSEVAGAYSAFLLQDILRKREGYRGVVITDWGVTGDCTGTCVTGRELGKISANVSMGKPWGVEGLTVAERFVATVKAGSDQIGDEEDATPLIEAVRKGDLTEARLDSSVRKILAMRFRLGLFESPFVDPEQATRIVGQPAFVAAGLEAQQRSLVLLENKGAILPLAAAGKKIFLRGIKAEAARSAGFTVVEKPEDADFAIIRAVTPWQRLHPNYIMGAIQHEGDLDFKPDNADLKVIEEAARHVPTIVSVYLDRPAILSEVRKHAAAVIANFGVSDTALLNVITGRAKPEGKLPFELPSSMASVLKQRSDTPSDSGDPLYRYGFGLKY